MFVIAGDDTGAGTSASSAAAVDAANAVFVAAAVD